MNDHSKYTKIFIFSCLLGIFGCSDLSRAVRGGASIASSSVKEADHRRNTPSFGQRSELEIEDNVLRTGDSIEVRLNVKDQNGKAVHNSKLDIIFSLEGGSSTVDFSNLSYKGEGIFLITLTGKAAGTPTRLHVSVDGERLLEPSPTLTVLAKPDFSSTSTL